MMGWHLSCCEKCCDHKKTTIISEQKFPTLTIAKINKLWD